MPKGDPKYHDEAVVLYNKKLEELMSALPDYCRTYFNAKKPHHQVRSLISYAYDFKTFFYYLQNNNPTCKNLAAKDIPFGLMENIGIHDIEEYAAFLQLYEINGVIVQNGPAAIKRKLSSLSSFFNYFRANEELSKNPVEKYQKPKIPSDNTITILENDEVITLLDALATQSVWTGRQIYYHQKTKDRDYAIYSLLLGTGIRISELVSINVEDLDLNHLQLRIIRKGNKKQDIWMSEDVADSILSYLNNERDNLIQSKDEPALFLSLQKTRLTVRQIEKMTEYIAKKLFPGKHVTPHKFRSSYGSSLVAETHDIYGVAIALGHASVETAKKHYLKQDLEYIKDISINHKLIK